MSSDEMNYRVMSRSGWRSRFSSRPKVSTDTTRHESGSVDVFPEARIKHLEFIQSVISRLATNSFLAKGWALTVSGVLDGFAVNHLNPWIALVGLVPVLAFWLLDAYFLRVERLFRCLYEDVRKPNSSVELLSMDYRPYRKAKRATLREM